LGVPDGVVPLVQARHRARRVEERQRCGARRRRGAAALRKIQAEALSTASAATAATAAAVLATAAATALATALAAASVRRHVDLVRAVAGGGLHRDGLIHPVVRHVVPGRHPPDHLLEGGGDDEQGAAHRCGALVRHREEGGARPAARVHDAVHARGAVARHPVALEAGGGVAGARALPPLEGAVERDLGDVAVRADLGAAEVVGAVPGGDGEGGGGVGGDEHVLHVVVDDDGAAAVGRRDGPLGREAEVEVAASGLLARGHDDLACASSAEAMLAAG
jgi:hypothetical protein